MHQAYTKRNGGASVQTSSISIAGLWMLLSVAAIAMSIASYAVYNHLVSKFLAKPVAEELLLQEDNSESELFALKLSQGRSSTLYHLVVITVFLAVLCLFVLYFYKGKQDEDSLQATNLRKKQVLSKMYEHTRNLERQLQVTSDTKRTEILRHEVDKHSLQRDLEQQLRDAEEAHQKRMAKMKDDHNKGINKLHSSIHNAKQKVEILKQECNNLEDQLLHERCQGEKLNAKLSEQVKGHKDKLFQQARYYEHKEQEWEGQKKVLEHETTKLRYEVEQLEQRAKKWEEQCAKDKHEFKHRLKMCQREWEQKERDLNKEIQECAANIKKEQERSKLELETQSAHFKGKLSHIQRILTERLDTQTKEHTEERNRLESEMLEHQKRFIQREKELKAVEANLTEELEWERKKHNQERMKLKAEVQDLQRQLSQQDTGMKAAGSRTWWSFPWGHKKEAMAPTTHSNNGATAFPPTDDDMR